MGSTSDTQFGCLTDDVLDCRTVKKIEDTITEESERKAISRFIHASIDKEKIAGWKQELRDRLQLFNVCLAVVTWSSLIVLFQVELGVDTNINVLGIRNDTSGMRNDISKILEGIGGQVQPVSASCIKSVNNRRMLTFS